MPVPARYSVSFAVARRPVKGRGSSMGRYADLKFVTAAEVPKRIGDLVVREAWAGRLFAAALLLGSGLAMPLLAWNFMPGAGWSFELAGRSWFEIAFFGIGGLTMAVVALVCLLAGLGFLSEALAAMKPTNWVLRGGDAGLYVKLRRFSDHRLPTDDPIVAVIPRRELRWLRGHGQRARWVGRRGEHASHEDDALGRQSYLEIALHGGGAQAIEERLDRERTLWAPTVIKGVRAQAKGAAVSVRSDGVLRIDWTTKGTRLRPGLDEALARLARDYPLATELETEQVQAKRLDRGAQEQRLLDMLRQGNTIDAVIVAKDLYGYSTTEAKRFLDELQGR
jgi:hypothetical protein